MEKELEVATLGAGCFWCYEAIFSEIKGVHSVRSGYSGGFVKNPAYREVCNGTTGHAEVIQVEFDSAVVSFAELLIVFFSVHDPTTLNRQGADIGTQYRSAIFYHDDSQKIVAEQAMQAAQESGDWSEPIVTEITAFSNFYDAGEYHADYFANNPNQGYCRVVVKPKLEKFKQKFAGMLK